MSSRTTWWGDAVRGAIAGGVATWLMDKATTGLQQAESKPASERESAARPNGQSSVANLVDRLDERLSLELDPPTKSRLSEIVHYGLGVLPGALYGVLRRRVPLVGAARGLAFGVVLWALNDEWANTTLGLSGPVRAYPLETHLRGAVGHLVLGGATDTTLDVLGG